VSLLTFKTSILQVIERLSEKKYWEWRLSFFCLIYIFLIAFPSYNDIIVKELLQFQIENPLSRIPESFIHSTHQQKHQFRITIPVLCKILHLRGFWPLLIQYSSAFLLLLFSYLLSLKITNDKVIATLCTITTSNIFAGMIGFYDVYWHFDCFAILMLLLAIYTNKNLFMALFLLAASFTDERAFIASSLVLVYKIALQKNSLTSFKDVFSNYGLSILFVWILYIVLRMYLINFHHFFTGTMDIGPSLFFYNYNTFPLSILFVFEGAWLVILLGIWKSIQNKWFVVLVSLSTFVILVTALMIADVSRSTAYLFPLFFIGLYKCNQYYKPYALRKIVLISTFLCIIIPTQQFSGDRIFGLGPIFPKILKLFN